MVLHRPQPVFHRIAVSDRFMLRFGHLRKLLPRRETPFERLMDYSFCTSGVGIVASRADAHLTIRR